MDAQTALAIIVCWLVVLVMLWSIIPPTPPRVSDSGYTPKKKPAIKAGRRWGKGRSVGDGGDNIEDGQAHEGPRVV